MARRDITPTPAHGNRLSLSPPLFSPIAIKSVIGSMSAAAASGASSIKMAKPINLIHSFKESGQRVAIWLLHDNHLRFEGVILGYDEFMNVVLDDAYGVRINGGGGATGGDPTASTTTRIPIGRTLLKGDTIGLVHVAEPTS